MTRLFVVMGLVAALLALATWEQIYIDKTYDKMKFETAALLESVNAHPDEVPFNIYTKKRVDELHDYWIKKERRMCVVSRHMELSYISDALIYARNFIHFDNKEEACAGLERLKYLLDAYSHIYGINGWNIL